MSVEETPVPENTAPGNDQAVPVPEVNPQEKRAMSPLEPELQGQPVPAQDAAEQAPAAPVEETPKIEDETHEPWPGLPPREPSKTVVQQFETYQRDHSGKPLDPDDGESLILPPDTYDRALKYDEERPNEGEGSTEQEVHWDEQRIAGELTRPVNGIFNDTVARVNSLWRQSIKSEQAGELMAARPRIVASAGDTILTGQRAVQRIRAVLGLGTLIQVPMWHSGFWITLRSPTEGAVLDLHRRLSDDKVTLGRRTYGLAFANSSSFIAGELVQFAFDHVNDTTLKPTLDWRKHMKIHDLQTLAWALACTIFPKGFQYSRSILVAENEEKREVKGLLNVSKLQFVDTARLTPWQVAHMSRRTGNTMSDEMLTRYQSEFESTERLVEFDNGLKMTLHVPTIDEYLQSGNRWITSITDMVDRAFQQPPSDEIRDRYISHYGKASVMRQFGHWIKDIIETDPDKTYVFNDPETLDQLLNTLSEIDSVRDTYFKAIAKFTDDTTISVIATPTVDESEENKLPRYPHLVPIDALYSFFTLLVQKNNRIAARMDL